MAAVDPARVEPSRARSLTENLVLWRTRSKKDQRELSDMLTTRGNPISAQAISAWENGKPMTVPNLVAYVELLADVNEDDRDTMLREALYQLALAHGEDKPRLLLLDSDLGKRSLFSVSTRTHDT
jgi:transcriptional regulator with XRE-family HTH domain